jgi:transposase-like protein
MYGFADLSAFEQSLGRGELSCMSCPGVLKPWGYARTRVVRYLHGEKTFRPRRTRCSSCKRTNVVVTLGHVPRHRDALEVMASAILSAAQGKGHRQIADELNRPAPTVRNWLGRFRANAEHLRVWGTVWTASLGIDDHLEPQGSAFADALEALGGAARSMILRLGLANQCPWELMNSMTKGLAFRGRADELRLKEFSPWRD